MPQNMGGWLDHPVRKICTGLIVVAIASTAGVLYGELTDNQAAARPFLIISILLASWLGGLLGGAVGTLIAWSIFLAYSSDLRWTPWPTGEDVSFFVAFMLAGVVINLFNAWRRTVEQRLVRLTREVSEERAHLEAMLASEVVGMVEVDPFARFLRVNERFCQMVGRTPEELVGPMSCFDLTVEDDLAATRHCFEALRAGASNFTLEKRLVKPDGDTVWVLNGLTGVRNEDGRLVSAFGVITDITTRKLTEEALTSSLAVKDQFLRLVSHELRTPIATIMGNALLLERRMERFDSETRRQIATDISSESARLHRIIENLLFLSRIDGKQQPTLEPVNLTRLITTVIAGFRSRKPDRALKVDVANDQIALGQEELIERILENLLSNADKYSEPNQSIEVRTSRNAGDEIEIRVIDSGIGVNTDELDAIFAPFFRSSQADAFARGMGLGLAVSRRLAEAQGGRIWARRRDEGGSEFTLALRSALEESDYGDGRPAPDDTGAAQSSLAEPEASTSASF